MNKSEIINYLKENGLSPNKKLGQNFLVNEAVCRKIAETAEITGRNILEIGPGLGSLTEFLALSAASLTAVEIDAGIFAFLRKKFSNSPSVEIVHSDILKYKNNNHFDAVVGNLPYYCSSEIIFHVNDCFEPEMAVFMLQKEMAERITAEAGHGNYGAFSASLALYYTVDLSFNVDKQSFYPVPDVTSTVIRLIRKKDIPVPKVREIFHQTVKSAFWGKRKTILKSLTDTPFADFSRENVNRALEMSGIDFKDRAETITTKKFLELAVNLQKERENGI